jgi:DNA adenine methylase
MNYPGGKNGGGAFHTLINLMPPHTTYIEPFLGSGAVMRHKRAAVVNIGLDLDPDAIRLATAGGIVKSGDGSSLEIHRGDGIEFLENWTAAPSDLVYCDPPYIMGTRRGGALYRYEMTDADHRRLLTIINRLRCMVMISGYYSELYARRLAKWNSIQYQAMTRGGRLATEWVWFNFPAPVALHDYRFLGQGFRERERITRKKKRWAKRLAAMPMLERRAMLAAIQEAWPT